jgi:protein TonB
MVASLLAHLALLAGFIWLAGAQASPAPALLARAVEVELLPGPWPGKGQGDAPAGAPPPSPASSQDAPVPPRPERIPPPTTPPRRSAALARPEGLRVQPLPLSTPATPAEAPAGPSAAPGEYDGAGQPAGAPGEGGAGGGGGLGEGLGGGQGGGLYGGGPDVPPRPLSRGQPRYPGQARREGVEGRVAVRLLVDREGRVGAVRIVAAQPPGHFEEAVREAVAGWTFRPAQKDGQPVEAWLTATISFRLED